MEMYCVKCKQKREISDLSEGTTKNGRTIYKGTCPECGSTTTRIGSAKKEG